MLPLAFAVASVAASLTASAFPADRGLEPPVAVVESDAGPSQGMEGAKVHVTCSVFKRFAVVEHNDPGLRGAARVEVRERAAGAAPAAVCADPKPGRVVLTSDDDVYFRGAVGPYLVFRGADGFGLAHPLLVLDATTGARVLDEVEAAATPAAFKRRGDVISVELARVVASDCKSPAECLARARSAWAIADDVRITLDAKSCPAAPAELLQVTVPLRVDDLRAPRPRGVAGVARCGVTP